MAVIRVINPLAVVDKKIRVCAYARVSTDSADQLNSFVEQVRHYNQLIKENKDWELVDIYADEGLTGLRMDKREDFLRMLKDCRRGKIDKILAKSISRFSRNTKDCLETIRELKDLNIEVEFEKEQINTGSVSSELLVTIIGAMAQEESISISNNMRWSYRERMQKGNFSTCKAPFGFKLVENDLIINEEEAVVVRWIFDNYLDGMGKQEIAEELTKKAVPKREGGHAFLVSMVNYILKNERYMGDALVQKRYTTETLPFKLVANNGEKNKYYITNSNEAIVSREIFKKAQEINNSRLRPPAMPIQSDYPLSKKIKCGNCGKTFKRKLGRDKIYWECRGHNQSKELCDVKQIHEQEIYNAFIRLYNTLKSNSRRILTPLLEQLETLRNKSLKNNKIAEIEKQILDLSEQNLVLNKLRSKEYLDAALFMSQINTIEKEISELRDKRRQLIMNSDEDKTNEYTQLVIDIIENGTPRMTTFDESLFYSLIDHISVDVQDEITFILVNGLRLKEQIERNGR